MRALQYLRRAERELARQAATPTTGLQQPFSTGAAWMHEQLSRLRPANDLPRLTRPFGTSGTAEPSTEPACGQQCWWPARWARPKP